MKQLLRNVSALMALVFVSVLGIVSALGCVILGAVTTIGVIWVLSITGF
jgi:hypothetical protein